MPTPTPLSPALSVLEELRSLGEASPVFIAMMDAFFVDDEEKNGQHSLEFRRGLAVGAYFTWVTYQTTKPEERDDLIDKLTADFCNRFLELLEVIGPRPRLQ